MTHFHDAIRYGLTLYGGAVRGGKTAALNAYRHNRVVDRLRNAGFSESSIDAAHRASVASAMSIDAVADALLALRSPLAQHVRNLSFERDSERRHETKRAETDLPMHTPQPDYLETAPAFACGPELVRQKEERLIEV